MGINFALATVTVLIARLFIDKIMVRDEHLFGADKQPADSKAFYTTLLQVVEYLTLGLVILVVATPNGIP
jgi:hypothetical protein